MPQIACSFSLPRRGNSVAQYEDAFTYDETAGRYAIADGTSEGCFTGLWAKLLVNDFVHRAQPGVEQWAKSLGSVQKLWDEDVSNRKFPWHAEPWVRQGAHATFLGLTIAGGNDTEVLLHEVPGEETSLVALSSRLVPIPFSAVAVGDACLLHTRNGALLRAFPVQCSAQFNNTPKLVGSRMPSDDIDERQCLWTNGRGQTGDRLWMMTDALAQWCLAEYEGGRSPGRELESLPATADSEKGFASWIEGLRNSGRLRNDDVTLLTILLL